MRPTITIWVLSRGVDVLAVYATKLLAMAAAENFNLQPGEFRISERIVWAE